MEAKGLFAGFQSVTIAEVNVNNVAGAYHDYRSPSSPDRGGREQQQRLKEGALQMNFPSR